MIQRQHHFISVIAGIELPAMIATEDDYDAFDFEERSTPVDPADANVVSSRMVIQPAFPADPFADDVAAEDLEQWHAPVLDIDFAAELIPSATPGHFHLYLDKPMPWSKYQALLMALADAGIIEPGYAAASVARTASFVRMPGVPKIGRSE